MLKFIKYQGLQGIVLYCVLLFFVILMISISVEYFPIQKNVAFLRIKQWVWRTYSAPTSSIWFGAFYIHVIFSTFCLLAGFTQFSPNLLNSQWHRKMGMVYIICVLFLAGPSGLIMSFFANGGSWSIAAFLILSVLWLVTTGMAFNTLKQRNYAVHGAWMILSYSLTLSALTLRAWKWGLINLTDINFKPMELYRWVAWLGWVPNFLVALFLIIKDIHLKLLLSHKNQHGTGKNSCI